MGWASSKEKIVNLCNRACISVVMWGKTIVTCWVLSGLQVGDRGLGQCERLVAYAQSLIPSPYPSFPQEFHLMKSECILIVEDDPAVARGLEYALSSEGFAVERAADGRTALRLVDERQPELILLDIRLPDLSGFDVCRQLRSAGKRQPILMLTARDEEMDKVLGLELGADDYVVKPYALRELLSRIRALLRRAYGELAQPVARKVLQIGPLTIDLERLLVTRNGQPLDLTPTEFRLLRHLASAPNRPFSRAALIEAVWGYGSDIENDRTVDVHMRHLRQKIEDNPADPRWLVTVRGVGYVLHD